MGQSCRESGKCQNLIVNSRCTDRPFWLAWRPNVAEFNFRWIYPKRKERWVVFGLGGSKPASNYTVYMIFQFVCECVRFSCHFQFCITLKINLIQLNHFMSFSFLLPNWLIWLSASQGSWIIRFIHICMCVYIYIEIYIAMSLLIKATKAINSLQTICMGLSGRFFSEPPINPDRKKMRLLCKSGCTNNNRTMLLIIVCYWDLFWSTRTGYLCSRKNLDDFLFGAPD